MSYELLFNKAADLIAQADALVICAGAGMGVDLSLIHISEPTRPY